MQRFSSWTDIEPTATPAEKKLKDAVISGEFCELKGGGLPDTSDDWNNPNPARHIRADVLRFFLLGGGTDCPATELGVMLGGALITGRLSLTDCDIAGNMLLHNCRFQNGINANNCRVQKGFQLASCNLPFLIASSLKIGTQLSCIDAELQNPGGTALDLQDANIGQGLFLRSAKILGEADLNALKCGGQLDCQNAAFQNPGNTALNLQRAEVRHDMLLISTTILGAATLNDLKTGGQLNCEGAKFQNPGGTALNLHNAGIGQVFYFRNQIKVQGIVNLTTASCGGLADQPECWPESGHLFLNGFSYRRVHGFTDARTRLEWLARGSCRNGQFFPQPYKQLAKVLHDMGHEDDAREVLYTLSRKLSEQRCNELRREIAEVRQTAPRMGLAIAKRLLLGGEHLAGALLRWVVGYGYKPFRSLGLLTGLIAACWIMAIGTWHAGDFAPNSSIVLASPEWAAYNTADKIPEPPNPAGHWSEHSIPGRDWESFHSLAYAADVVIPIIDFGQTGAWAPSKERGWWGTSLWWLRWVFTTLGWIVTALGAAALTGIIRRE